MYFFLVISHTCHHSTPIKSYSTRKTKTFLKKGKKKLMKSPILKYL